MAVIDLRIAFLTTYMDAMVSSCMSPMPSVTICREAMSNHSTSGTDGIKTLPPIAEHDPDFRISSWMSLSLQLNGIFGAAPSAEDAHLGLL